MNEGRFARLSELLDGVFEECGSLGLSEATADECVAALSQLKTVAVAIEGLSVALVGKVADLQSEEFARRESMLSGSSGLGDDAVAGGDGSDLRIGDAVRSTAGARAEWPSLPGPDSSLRQLVARRGKKSPRAAGKGVYLATFAAESFPAFVECMRRGEISGVYLDVLKRVDRTPALMVLAQDAEEDFIDWAQSQDVDQFRRSVKAWERENGVKAARRSRAPRRENITLYPEDDGFKVSGWLTGSNGAAILTAARQVLGTPRPENTAREPERIAQGLMSIVRKVKVRRGIGMAALGEIVDDPRFKMELFADPMFADHLLDDMSVGATALASTPFDASMLPEPRPSGVHPCSSVTGKGMAPELTGSGFYSHSSDSRLPGTGLYSLGTNRHLPGISGYLPGNGFYFPGSLTSPSQVAECECGVVDFLYPRHSVSSENVVD